MIKKTYTIILLAIVMLASSCYTQQTAGRSGKIPPGQAKKRTGAKSAKHYAPGHQKKRH
ncbi:quinol oxidase subunit 4 [Pedobacter sp.]|uniref:quinol oxidase subunit 4 n=1 Tax=Pedobacter sp. TaxID=1411316 RepID=UPI003D7FAB15